MVAFRGVLGVIFAGLLVYTLIVGMNHGWNLIPVFFGDIQKIDWPGQFNADLMGFLILSGLWVSWRHQFTLAGLGLGVLAFFGGSLFLSAYLLIASFNAQGDVRELFLGRARAPAA